MRSIIETTIRKGIPHPLPKDASILRWKDSPGTVTLWYTTEGIQDKRTVTFITVEVKGGECIPNNFSVIEVQNGFALLMR